MTTTADRAAELITRLLPEAGSHVYDGIEVIREDSNDPIPCILGTINHGSHGLQVLFGPEQEWAVITDSTDAQGVLHALESACPC